MRKPSLLLAAALLVCSPAFATYFVVMKDGSQYRAKAKPTVVKGVATFQTESGGTMRVDANSIDFAKSDDATRLGGGAVIGVDQTNTAAPKQQESTLGTAFRLRHLHSDGQPAVTNSTAPPPVSGPMLSDEVLRKFERAYENVGIFEHKLKATGPHSLRAEVTTDDEVSTFNAISATSFLLVRNAGVAGAQIDEVDLFLGMTNGGSAGRFQMTRADAQALDSKTITREEYFIRKVVF